MLHSHDPGCSLPQLGPRGLGEGGCAGFRRLPCGRAGKRLGVMLGTSWGISVVADWLRRIEGLMEWRLLSSQSLKRASTRPSRKPSSRCDAPTYKSIPTRSSEFPTTPLVSSPLPPLQSLCTLVCFRGATALTGSHVPDLVPMMGFSLTPPNSSFRAASEFGSLKRSAKSFSLKKATLTFHKPTTRRSHDGSTSSSTRSAPSTPTRAHTLESPYGDDVICISREDNSDPSNADEASNAGEVSPDDLQTPSASPYASSYSSSSSSYYLSPQLDDQVLSPVNEDSDESNPRRGSQISMVSSWVDHHLQELDISYDEDAIYEIEIVTTDDGFPSRRDSLTLPPHEIIQPCQNPPVVPAPPRFRHNRPLPCTPLTNTNLSSQSRRVRPLPPPPPSPPW